MLGSCGAPKRGMLRAEGLGPPSRYYGGSRYGGLNCLCLGRDLLVIVFGAGLRNPGWDGPPVAAHAARKVHVVLLGAQAPPGAWVLAAGRIGRWGVEGIRGGRMGSNGAEGFAAAAVRVNEGVVHADGPLVGGGTGARGIIPQCCGGEAGDLRGAW